MFEKEVDEFMLIITEKLYFDIRWIVVCPSSLLDVILDLVYKSGFELVTCTHHTSYVPT